MSRKYTTHVRLNVEELEGRQVPSGQVTPTGASPLSPAQSGQPGPAMHVDYGTALAPRAQTANAPQPMVWTYTVVGLRNPTGAAIQVQFRWTHDSAWTTCTVPAHGYYYFYVSSYEPVAPQVRFDSDLSGRSRIVQVNLRYNTVRTSGTPSYNDAFHYAFARQGQTLTLHTSAS
jgi:hypothetical protein